MIYDIYEQIEWARDENDPTTIIVMTNGMEYHSLMEAIQKDLMGHLYCCNIYLSGAMANQFGRGLEGKSFATHLGSSMTGHIFDVFLIANSQFDCPRQEDWLGQTLLTRCRAKDGVVRVFFVDEKDSDFYKFACSLKGNRKIMYLEE